MQNCEFNSAKMHIFVQSLNFSKMKSTPNIIHVDIPKSLSEGEILSKVYSMKINNSHLLKIKELSSFSDVDLSEYLNISVRSLHSYIKKDTLFKTNLKEPIIYLLYLLKHGIKVFGSKKEFDNWLNSENFFFDGKKPVNFLNTITGIRFIDDRLTAMEYGDNV